MGRVNESKVNLDLIECMIGNGVSEHTPLQRRESNYGNE